MFFTPLRAVALRIVETRDQGPGHWLFATGRLIEIIRPAFLLTEVRDGSSAKIELFYPSYAVFKERITGVPQAANPRKNRVTGCGADRDRTDDIQLAKLALSQLSYSPRRTSP